MKLEKTIICGPCLFFVVYTIYLRYLWTASGIHTAMCCYRVITTSFEAYLFMCTRTLKPNYSFSFSALYQIES